MEQHLEYKNAHCPGVFQFIIKRMEEPKDNLHFCCIFHVQIQSIQKRTNE